MVLCRSDHPDEFTVPLDDPDEETTKRWQDDLHDRYTCRDDQCSVKSDRVSSGVSQRRRSSNFWSCLKRGSVSARTHYRRHVNVTPTVPQEALLSCFHRSHQLLPGSNAVFRLCHLVAVPSLRKMDSTNWAHIPGISRAPTNGASVLDKIATTAKMICAYVLIVGATCCWDRVVRAFPLVDVLPTTSPCVDIFHVDPSHSRDSGTAWSKKLSDESCALGTARWTCDESGGSVHICRRSWMQSTPRATGQTCLSRRSNEVASKIGIILETDPPLWRWLCGTKITISSGLSCRFGS